MPQTQARQPTPDPSPGADATSARERELRTVLDFLPTQVIRLDRALRYRYANQRHCAFFALDPSALERGLDCAAVLGAEAMDELRPALQQALEGEPASLEIRLARAGGPRWLHLSLMPDVDAEWEVEGVLVVADDVTESHLAARKLADSEERLRLLVETSPDIFYFVSTPDRDRWHYVSPAVRTVWGYRGPLEPGPLHAHLDATIDTRDLQRYWGRAARERRGETVDIEYRIHHPERGPRWLRTRTFGVRRDDGEVRVYGMTEDVTERREQQDALRRSELRLREFAEVGSDWFWETDPAHRFTYFAHRGRVTTGLDPETLVGRSRLELLRKLMSEETHREHEETLRERRPFRNLEYGIVREDGERVWLSVSGAPMYDADGSFAGYRGTGTDVSVRVRLQEAARRNMRLLERTVEHMPMGVSVMDDELNVIAFNEAFMRMLDFPPERFDRGDPLEKFLRYNAGRGEYGPGDATEQVEARLALARRFEPHRFQRTRGDGVVLEVAGNPVPGGGFVTLYTDVSERKELERRLVEARENAEATARAKSEFLATMSHEIRTPMNGVLGLAELLLETRLEPEQRAQMETLHRSAQALLEILNDILDLSKIEAGKLALEPIAFDLVDAVEDVAGLWAPRAAAKGIELAVQIAFDCPRHVVGDPGRIRQVLGNFVGNAIKFTAEGHVVVEVRCEAREADAATLRFAVRDSGIGLSPEAQARLFRPFAQADASTTRRYGGTGLGLAICKRLADLMGGEIGVDSEAGRGAEFHFRARLPLAPAPEEVRLAELAGVRALLVDDHPVNRLVLEAQLAGFGLRAAGADGAPAAERMARDALADGDPFRIAVLDQCMPDVDGIELGRRLRAALGASAPRLVLLTSAGRKGDGATAREAGFAGFLAKPARRDQLRDLLAAALGMPPQGGMMTRHRLPETGPRFRGKVLLAEDNAVNRQLATTVLRRLGVDVVTAENGAEAVRRVAAEPFDLVFMDLHMPEMDGIEATLAIRAAGPGARRVPVIALTASVMQESRDACVAAGMDGFVPKPFERKQLVAVLQQYLPSAAPAGAGPAPVAGAPAGAVLDPARLAAAREAMEDDFPQLVQAYLDSAAALLQELRAGAGDAAALYRPAHTLKSSSANLGAMTVSALAGQLEADARRGQVPDAPARIDALASAFEAAHRELAPLATTETTDGTH